MSFWNKVKDFFGGGGGDGSGGDGDGGGKKPLDAESLLEAVIAAPGGHDPDVVRAVGRAAIDLANDGKMFAPADILRATPGAAVPGLRAWNHLVDCGFVEALGYTRTNHVFHPPGADPSFFHASSKPPAPQAGFANPAMPRPAAVPQTQTRTQTQVQGPQRPPPAQPGATVRATGQLPNAFENKEILGLSAEDARKRSLKINPYNTPWIGRVDTIPPQSDERTALIDRGLILRGLLTEDQIREIHKVGDVWLRHHDAVKLAESAAKKSVDAALLAERQEKTRIKAEKKRLAAEKKIAHAAAVLERRETDIIFLGRGVSSQLHDRRGNIEALEAKGLPVLTTPMDVARALGITLRELRFLSFHADAATRTNYVYFEVPKRSGGMRLLASPHRKLRAAQSWIFKNVLSKLTLHDAAHGFVKGRSTVTNAQHHLAREIVINLDLKDFFPSVTFARVRGLFAKIGYSPAVATILALLTTEAPRVKATHDGATFWVAVGERGLPQGACTSPMISNVVTRTLDARLTGIAKKAGFVYTRYADDLAFSGDAKENVARLLTRVRHVLGEEGFRLNPKKGRIQRNARRQDVTGVVVNDKPGVPREEVRRIRAILHGAKKTGLAAQNRAGHENFEAHLRGKIAYVQMIDREKGEKLMAALNALS